MDRSFTTMRWCSGLTWLCLAIIAGLASSIEIVGKQELVHVVENGSVEAYLLDCPYELADDDTEGLHVKWFHVNNPVQVYQWIYPNPPQSVGILEDRVDLEYIASDEPFHQHRALHILDPTTDLSGDYTCNVASFYDEKKYTQKLIVYSQPLEIRVWTEKRTDAEVTVLCEVDQVYPEPEISLVVSSSRNSTELRNMKEVKMWSEGSYNAMVEADINELDLMGPVSFVCDVNIPHTDLNFNNMTSYEPSIEEIDGIEVTVVEEAEATVIEDEVISSGPTVTSYASVLLGIAILLVYM